MKGFTPHEDWMKLPFMTQTPYSLGHTDRDFRNISIWTHGVQPTWTNLWECHHLKNENKLIIEKNDVKISSNVAIWAPDPIEREQETHRRFLPSGCFHLPQVPMPPSWSQGNLPMPPIQDFFLFCPSYTYIIAKIFTIISFSILTITQHSLPLGSRLRHSIAAYSYWNFQFQQPESAYIQVFTL